MIEVTSIHFRRLGRKVVVQATDEATDEVLLEFVVSGAAGARMADHIADEDATATEKVARIVRGE